LNLVAVQQLLDALMTILSAGGASLTMGHDWTFKSCSNQSCVCIGIRPTCQNCCDEVLVLIDS
jgi:hypothetical protein